MRVLSPIKLLFCVLLCLGACLAEEYPKLFENTEEKSLEVELAPWERTRQRIALNTGLLDQKFSFIFEEQEYSGVPEKVEHIEVDNVKYVSGEITVPEKHFPGRYEFTIVYAGDKLGLTGNLHLPSGSSFTIKGETGEFYLISIDKSKMYGDGNDAVLVPKADEASVVDPDHN